jgi:hypothetical protein
MTFFMVGSSARQEPQAASAAVPVVPFVGVVVLPDVEVLLDAVFDGEDFELELLLLSLLSSPFESALSLLSPLSAGVVGLEQATTLNMAKRAETERTVAIFMMGSYDFFLRGLRSVCVALRFGLTAALRPTLKPGFFEGFGDDLVGYVDLLGLIRCSGE